MSVKITNAMSIDVEDYFQVGAFEKCISRDDWDSLPHRVEQNTDHVLSIMDDAGVKATFFTLGWVAERYPQLIQRIVENGHELASHGMAHWRVTDQQPEDFREDVSATKKLLEDVGGQAVRGYRAASFSIGERNLWALDVLAEEGYLYSSSIFQSKKYIEIYLYNLYLRSKLFFSKRRRLEKFNSTIKQCPRHIFLAVQIHVLDFRFQGY